MPYDTVVVANFADTSTSSIDLSIMCIAFKIDTDTSASVEI